MRDVKRFFRVFDLESDSYLDISEFIKKLNILSFSMKEEDKMTLFDYADPLKENKVNSDI
jgi:Ca2+-binding EF-hand superfamily protein